MSDSDSWVYMKAIGCQCKPATDSQPAITCMLHWNMDEWLLAFTAARPDVESTVNEMRENNEGRA